MGQDFFDRPYHFFVRTINESIYAVYYEECLAYTEAVEEAVADAGQPDTDEHKH